MFLTQQLPGAGQRALGGYGWMSVLRPLLNHEHLEETGGVCPMFTTARTLQGSSSRGILGDLGGSWGVGGGPSAATSPCSKHLPGRGLRQTHSQHVDAVFPPPQTTSMETTHTHKNTHHPSPSWLAHNGQLMSPRPQDLPREPSNSDPYLRPALRLLKTH